ncbi:MAG: hypothetical protein HY764_00950 [Candidatus Portnoybacteria bacterium]|nr:hypothetical protein [Candidatus Portnoybacteria bacterium]
MFYRSRKQIAIVSIVILCLIIVGVIFYFSSRPQPNCFDGIRNQGEQEIDCGGPCISCEVLTLKDIQIDLTQAIKSREGVYDLVAKVKNPNPNFGVPYFKYRFDLKDKNGQIVISKEGASFILPNSSRYIIENNIVSSEEVASAKLEIEKIDKNSWQQLRDYQSPDLYINDKNLRIDNASAFLAEATGVVENRTSFDLDKVYVDIVIFNQAGKAIAVSNTEIRTLTAGENRHFSAKWFYQFLENIKPSLDMQVETNLFLDDNYMRKHGNPDERGL